jgi:hypothetical protein
LRWWEMRWHFKRRRGSARGNGGATGSPRSLLQWNSQQRMSRAQRRSKAV